MSGLMKLTNEFEGNPVTTITYKGKNCWIAAEIGRAIGYANKGGRLVTKITGSWKDELAEGRDYAILRGDELVEFKQLLEPTAKLAGSRASHLMLLFEPGLHFVCLKTKKPIGVKLRRFLVDEVMPQLVRDGQYLPNREVVDGKLIEKGLMEERRLMAEFEQRTRETKSKAIREMIGTLKDMGRISEDLYASYSVSATEILTGENYSLLKPPTEDNWLSPTELGKRYGVTPQRIGRIVTALGLRGNINGISRAIVNKARNHNKTVVTYLYSPKAAEMIKEKCG